MKKVLLIGDSIRMGYDKYVKDALDGTAEVFYPKENCKMAVYVLRFLQEWMEFEKWDNDFDLVHINFGLWDVLELYGDKPLTPIEVYADYVKRIDKRLRLLFPKAKVVFATSTPVLEDKCLDWFSRKNATIKAYNDIAVKALKEIGSNTVINDLYSLCETFPVSFHSDAVHFYTPEATDKIGKQVLSHICTLLDIPAKNVNIKDFKPENYTKQNIGG